MLFRSLVEDFDASPPVKAPASEVAADDREAGGTVTIHLERKKVSVPQVAGETLLESARRAGLSPPFSCEAGNCGTCMARLTDEQGGDRYFINFVVHPPLPERVWDAKRARNKARDRLDPQVDGMTELQGIGLDSALSGLSWGHRAVHAKN